MNKNSRLVYSTDQGRIKPENDNQARPAGDGIVRIHRETKGRKGKGVTLVKGFDLNDKALKDMGKALKQVCGTGGTVKDGVIEIQGDHRDKILAYLLDKGITAKIAGG